VEVATDPRLPQPYTIDTRYHSVGTASESAFKFTFLPGDRIDDAASTTYESDVNCAEQKRPQLL